MKKLMILGGSANQIPLIKNAKQLGFSVLLCDYQEDNPGKELGDQFYCVSTLDKEAVFEIAKKERIDGIITNSEPAMLTASYVGNRLGLLSNPYDSIVILSRKDLFREFLRSNGFNCPQSYDSDNYKSAKKSVADFKFPLMVKPVDSSGSRGISRIYSVDEMKEAFDNALSFSKIKRVVVEEYIEKNHDYMIGGDIFVVDGKVAFWGLMNCLRDDLVNSFVPVGKSFPAFITERQFLIAEDTINSILGILNIKFGAFNVEFMFGGDDHLFMIEMNPRNGGNKIPEILLEITGVDLFKATVQASLGVMDMNLYQDSKNSFISTYILHTDRNGLLKSVEYSDEIKENILKVHMNKQIGDFVERFENADKLIGIAFLEFSSLNEMKNKLKGIKDLIEISVE